MSEGAGAALPAERAVDDAEDLRHQQRGRDALHDPGRDQRARGRGEPAREGRAGERREAERVHPSASEQVAEPPAGDQPAAEGQPEPGDDPLDRRRAGPQIRLDVGYRHVTMKKSSVVMKMPVSSTRSAPVDAAPGRTPSPGRRPAAVCDMVPPFVVVSLDDLPDPLTSAIRREPTHPTANPTEPRRPPPRTSASQHGHPADNPHQRPQARRISPQGARPDRTRRADPSATRGRTVRGGAVRSARQRHANPAPVAPRRRVSARASG